MNNPLIFVKNNLTPPVIFITFLNIGFFMIVQIAFFYIIASKQIDVIIESKADILSNYTKQSHDAKTSVDKYLNSKEFKDKENKARQQKLERLRLNRKIIWIKLKTFLLTVGIIIMISLLFIILFSFKRVQTKLNISKERASSLTLSLSDKVLILFVLGAFSTELLFFFGMVNRYEFVGDIEIINSIYRYFAKHYNKIN